MALAELFTNLYRLILGSVMDFAFFLFVDIVVKTTLKETTSDAEKRTIWLYETFALGLLCLGIYAFDHVPYILILLTATTLMVTQFSNRLNVHNWWRTVQTRWEEYQQHQESIRRDQRAMAHQQAHGGGPPHALQRGPAQQSTLVSAMLQKLTSLRNLFTFQRLQGQPRTATAVAAPTRMEQQNHQQSSGSSGSVGSRGSPQVTVRWRGQHGQSGSQPAPEIYTRQTRVSASTPHLGEMSSNDSSIQFQERASLATVTNNPKLIRKLPPSSSLSKPLKRKPLRDDGTGSSTLSLKSKVMSVLGFNPYVKVPPGLKNDGQNLCFMNSVLQCLARTPYLVDRLSTEAYEEASCSVAESAFLSSLTELLRYCNMPAGTSDITALDPAALQQAASCLLGSPVVPVGHRQSQQDVSEFLMWLLIVLHQILNKNRKGKTGLGRQPFQDEQFTSTTLAMLKFIYGDLNANRIQDLKQACNREIKLANGLDNKSYAEPIQRLSDLEWLTYKQQNGSIVDDLFTGQLVEAFHCLTDHHISVHMQTFIVLPVPIVAPREVSGIVYLEDCFTKFCNVEHLVGPEGLQCSMCDQQQRPRPNPMFQQQHHHPQNVSGGLHTPQSSMPNLSPGSGVVGGPFTPTQGNNNINMTDFRHLHTPHESVPNFRPHPSQMQTRNKSRCDSAIGVGSLISDYTTMSPIPTTDRTQTVSNDSGYNDTHFKTSTPILQRTNGGGFVPTPPPTRIRLRDAQRRCLLRQLPECLVIQMLRFAMNLRVGDVRKIRAPVSIPLKNLDLTSLIFDTVTNREDLTAAQNYKYDLYAVSTHLGGESTTYGHYVSYCMNQDDGTWCKFDDERVTEVNMEYELTTKELRENSYLLFYKRQPSTSK